MFIKKFLIGFIISTIQYVAWNVEIEIEIGLFSRLLPSDKREMEWRN